jgi:hypothetical protein
VRHLELSLIPQFFAVLKNASDVSAGLSGSRPTAVVSFRLNGSLAGSSTILSVKGLVA